MSRVRTAKRWRQLRTRHEAGRVGAIRRPPVLPAHVLFVADLCSYRNAVAYFTRLLGYPVRAMASVEEVITMLPLAPVDIVVVEEELDVQGLLATLRTQGRSDVLVIVVALVLTPEDTARWMQQGAFHCLPKPFDLRTYRIAVEQATAELRARWGKMAE
jgi:DNA-binding NtrC family response regulator